ncbi:bifunctional metallophosphatase/5'-nucleotidase, partial [Mycolicibacterium phlei]|uniref:bifunctional metallophosphatase/5'-nucleotidase n=1 Tax=Mycolicibacterium phlei TaxID=1771 RepID=UPI0037C83DE6
MRRVTAFTGAIVLATGVALAFPTAANAADGDTEIQILGINDFHGRIVADGQNAGAAVVAGAVKQLTAGNPNTVFAGAGDFIGASIFESYSDHDDPTIDALNESGMQVSSVGNHEFDQGYEDLIKHVIPRANWEYLGANVQLKAGGDALAPTWTTTVAGVKIGFVGAVTEHLHELVSPAGISMLDITDIAKAVNGGAAALRADGAQIVVMLVHEGYADTSCTGLTDPASDLGRVIRVVSGDIDAVLSGHTHLEYDCTVPLAQRSKVGNPTRDLPVMQAGKYGAALDQLVFSVDASGAITGIDHQLLPLTSQDADGNWSANYPADASVAAVVDAAVAKADALKGQKVGTLSEGYYRATTADGSENRGGESNLGNLVAESQRYGAEKSGAGTVDLAVMNPGGLRADLLGNNAGGYPATVTYGQANDVQPFGNGMMVMTLTGAQLKQVLEEQWQPDGASRPILRLGLSSGFQYTYDPAAARNQHVTAMWLDGKQVLPTDRLRVAANSFLAAGGDNFETLASGTNRVDIGILDLQATLSYFEAMSASGAIPADDAQHSVGVAFPSAAPASYAQGGAVTFTLSSL